MILLKTFKDYKGNKVKEVHASSCMSLADKLFLAALIAPLTWLVGAEGYQILVAFLTGLLLLLLGVYTRNIGYEIYEFLEADGYFS